MDGTAEGRGEDAASFWGENVSAGVLLKGAESPTPIEGT
jgi:hypothetical protein